VTGCFDGHTSQLLWLACCVVGDVQFVTCDVDPERVRETGMRLSSPLADRKGSRYAVHTCRGIDLPELRAADFVFCDSDYSARIDEMLACKPGAVIVVHDTRISYHPPMEPLAGWVEAHGGIAFTTHRGFGIVKVPAAGWAR
jgi:hypothetical protein